MIKKFKTFLENIDSEDEFNNEFEGLTQDESDLINSLSEYHNTIIVENVIDETEDFSFTEYQDHVSIDDIDSEDREDLEFYLMCFRKLRDIKNDIQDIFDLDLYHSISISATDSIMYLNIKLPTDLVVGKELFGNVMEVFQSRIGYKSFKYFLQTGTFIMKIEL